MESAWFLIFVIIYQQIENYLLRPTHHGQDDAAAPRGGVRGGARWGSISGLPRAFMALPAAAVIQSTISTYLKRHEVVETQLTREDAVLIEERNSSAEGEEKEEGMFGRISARWRRPET